MNRSLPRTTHTHTNFVRETRGTKHESQFVSEDENKRRGAALATETNSFTKTNGRRSQCSEY